MQRILSIAIVFVMLGSTILWAQRGIEKGRNYNRNSQWKSDTKKNPNWGTVSERIQMVISVPMPP